MKEKITMTIGPGRGISSVGGESVLTCADEGHADAFIVVNGNASIFRPPLDVLDGWLQILEIGDPDV